MYGVIKFQAPFERLKEYGYSAEVRLNKAILTQAIIDSTNVTADKNAKKWEIEAKNWIFGNSEYFQDVCCMANIEPSFVIKIAKEAIKLSVTKAMNFCVEEVAYGRKKSSLRRRGKAVAQNVATRRACAFGA